MKSVASLLLLLALLLPNCLLGQHRFIENKGQWPAQVRYRTALPNGFLFVENAGFTYLLYDVENWQAHASAGGVASKTAAPQPGKGHVVRVQFEGANVRANYQSMQPWPEHYNFFLGNEPSQWAGAVKAYAAASAKNIYEGIDLRIGQQQGQLKYEFEVSAGISSDRIKMRYQGHDSLWVASNGHLFIRASFAEWQEMKPYCYQNIKGQRVEVPASFAIKDSTVTFRFPKGYNKQYALVIDPVLVVSTYSGSTQDNWGFTATYDEQGNIYSAGMTRLSGRFPTTSGAFLTNPINGNSEDITDIGILKFNEDGSKLLYATYLGGTSTDIPHSLIVDNRNRLVVLGTTSSINFPTTQGAFQRSFAGGNPTAPLGGPDFTSGIFYNNGSDIFIAIFDSAGRKLDASTYWGGSGNDGLNLASRGALARNYGDQFLGDLAIDSLNRIYVVGVSRSTNMPVTLGAHQTSLAGPQDAVVARFSSALSLDWATYLGGARDDGGYSLKLDADGHVLLCGGTSSEDFPTTSGALHETFRGGVDAYLVRLASDGSRVLHGTFLGTENHDQAYQLDLDPAGNVAVFGQTLGNYPVSDPSLFHQPKSGQFIHKLNAALSETVFSTIFGAGKANDSGVTVSIRPTAFMMNDCGQILLSGWGGAVNGTDPSYLAKNTAGLPLTGDDGIPATRGTSDGSDFYLMMLSADAKKLLYGTYIGGDSPSDGDHVDGGTSRFDKKRGTIYQSVCACRSNTFPSTPNAFSTTNRATGLCNNLVFKFEFEGVKALVDPFIQGSGGWVRGFEGCAPLSVQFPSTGMRGKQMIWDFGDGKIESFSSLRNVVHVYETAGEFKVSVTVIDSTTCQLTDIDFGVVRVLPTNFSVSKNVAICIGDSTQLQATGGNSYLWRPGKSLSDSTIANPIAFPVENTAYTVIIKNENGCTDTLTINVNTGELGLLDAGIRVIDECGKATRVTFWNETGGEGSFLWTLPDGTTTTDRVPSEFQMTQAGTFTITLLATGGRCEQRRTFTFQSVLVSEPPNVITPNGDGKNDTFEVKGIGDGWQLQIFTRWGKLIYENDSYKNDWGGEGSLGEGFFYLLTSPSGNTCKGIIEMLGND